MIVYPSCAYAVQIHFYLIDQFGDSHGLRDPAVSCPPWHGHAADTMVTASKKPPCSRKAFHRIILLWTETSGLRSPSRWVFSPLTVRRCVSATGRRMIFLSALRAEMVPLRGAFRLASQSRRGDALKAPGPCAVWRIGGEQNGVNSQQNSQRFHKRS